MALGWLSGSGFPVLTQLLEPTSCLLYDSILTSLLPNEEMNRSGESEHQSNSTNELNADVDSLRFKHRCRGAASGAGGYIAQGTIPGCGANLRPDCRSQERCEHLQSMQKVV